MCFDILMSTVDPHLCLALLFVLMCLGACFCSEGGAVLILLPHSWDFFCLISLKLSTLVFHLRKSILLMFLIISFKSLSWINNSNNNVACCRQSSYKIDFSLWSYVEQVFRQILQLPHPKYTCIAAFPSCPKSRWRVRRREHRHTF